jgi:hypothetical protein
MGYNPHEHVCEWFDFECMCTNYRNVYLWKDFNNLIKSTLKPYSNGDTLYLGLKPLVVVSQD